MSNKNYHNWVAVLIMITVTFSSCKKSFLEINPKGLLIAKTTSDFQQLLVNQSTYTVYASAHVNMSDEVAAVNPDFSVAPVKDQRIFKWQPDIYNPDQDADEVVYFMQSIYLYNYIINEVMNSYGGSDQQKRAIRAQALVGRAWTYFQLINFFGKPFNNTTSATDAGFPIITVADVSGNVFSRASVKEVYDFILGDLNTAIPDLPVGIPHRLSESQAAAYGIRGKVYVFMGRFSEAKAQFDLALSAMTKGSVVAGLYNYNVELASGGAFTPFTFYFGPNPPSIEKDFQNIYGKQMLNSWAGSNQFVLNPQTVALFQSTDLRNKWYDGSRFFGSQYPLGMKRRVGPTFIQVGVLTPDLFLLRAECEARLNDLNAAVTDVQTLRNNRISSVTDASVPSSIASNQSQLVKFILQERVREFALLGYRWFDMRRLSVDPDYSSTVVYTHTLYNVDGSVNQTYTLTPERLTLRFNQKLMAQNPGIQNNP